MKLGFSLRIFIVYFLIIGVLSWMMLQKALDALDLNVRQVAEEILVDTANWIATDLGRQMASGTLDMDDLAVTAAEYRQRVLDARIYQEIKDRPDLDFYITDASGRVVFNTSGQGIGADYSAWRDVALTLRGEYGARTSPAASFIAEGMNSVFHVAAPIMDRERIVGVVTVYKPIARFGGFLAHSADRLTTYALIVGLMSLVFGSVMSLWLSRATRKLVDYADELATNRRVAPPALWDASFSRVAAAMAAMQQKLADKDYVERYVHALTHELKAPLTGLRGATEILMEDNVPPAKRAKFLDNIRQLTDRMTTLVQRLLTLASLENRRALGEVSEVELAPMVRQLVDERAAAVAARDVEVVVEEGASVVLRGEVFLLSQAVSNLLDNALDFSPAGGLVCIAAGRDAGGQWVAVRDRGPGIPEYALAKIYDRFFSLSRPGGASKSTGLGLSFVREVMALHGGSVSVGNRSDGGVEAVLRWP